MDCKFWVVDQYVNIDPKEMQKWPLCIFIYNNEDITPLFWKTTQLSLGDNTSAKHNTIKYEFYAPNTEEENKFKQYFKDIENCAKDSCFRVLKISIACAIAACLMTIFLTAYLFIAVVVISFILCCCNSAHSDAKKYEIWTQLRQLYENPANMDVLYSATPKLKFMTTQSHVVFYDCQLHDGNIFYHSLNI